MPTGELVTVPVPLPVLLTFRVCDTAVNVAVTERFEVIETVQVFPKVESHPLQLVNVEPLAALAVKVTDDPLAYEAEHVLGQVIPAGELVTVPEPVPARFTVKEFVEEQGCVGDAVLRGVGAPVEKSLLLLS